MHSRATTVTKAWKILQLQRSDREVAEGVLFSSLNLIWWWWWIFQYMTFSIKFTKAFVHSICQCSQILYAGFSGVCHCGRRSFQSILLTSLHTDHAHIEKDIRGTRQLIFHILNYDFSTIDFLPKGTLFPFALCIMLSSSTTLNHLHDRVQDEKPHIHFKWFSFLVLLMRMLLIKCWLPEL